MERVRQKGNLKYVNQSQFSMKDLGPDSSSKKTNAAQRDTTFDRKSDQLYYREGAMNYISQQALQNKRQLQEQQALQQAGTGSHFISVGPDERFDSFPTRQTSLKKSKSQSNFLETLPHSRLQSGRLSKLESGRKLLGAERMAEKVTAEDYDRYIQTRNNDPEALASQRNPIHHITSFNSARGKSVGGRENLRGSQMEGSVGKRCDSSMTRKLNFLKS